MKRSRAVLLDRDGIINEMVYYPEHGIVDSPFMSSQFALVEGIGEALRNFKERGYKLIVVSNQPGVAKKHYTMKMFQRMRRKMVHLLAREGVKLDGEYYCFHHPQARVAEYRGECECRKPKPGLLFKAAREHAISLPDSVIIGDGLSDVIAGKKAGCRTVLVTNLNSLLAKLMTEGAVEPDFIARNLAETIDIVNRLNWELKCD